MKSILLRASLVSVLATVAAFGQQNAPDPDFGLINTPNGRFWTTSSKEMKIAMLYGFILGMEWAGMGYSAEPACSSWELQKKVQSQWIGKNTAGELSDALDSFYADPANRQIEITGGMRWFQTKVAGASAAELDDLLIKMRKGHAAR
jgi:hypothetical protein